MPLTPHILVTAVLILAVIAAGWLIVRAVDRACRRSALDSELRLTRQYVRAGQFTEANTAHDRAEAAWRPGMILDDADATLLALGPMSLLEPAPMPIRLEVVDPLDLVGTHVMRSVLADRP